MRILLVDDEPDIVAFYREVAASEGFTQVDSVSTAEEAVSRVLRDGYDLILLDISMPGVSGLEIISILRDMCSHALIVVVSGFIPDDVPSEALACIDLLLSKPIGVAVLGQLLAGAAEMCQLLARMRELGDVSQGRDRAIDSTQATAAGADS